MSKPQRFEIGQAVTPNSKLWVVLSGKDNKLPVFGKIYHVLDYLLHKGEWYISVREIGDNDYHVERGFDHIELTTEQIEELAEMTKPVEV